LCGGRWLELFRRSDRDRRDQRKTGFSPRDEASDQARRDDRNDGDRHAGDNIDKVVTAVERRRRQHDAVDHNHDRPQSPDRPQGPGVKHRRRRVKAREGHDAAKTEQLKMTQHALAGRRQIAHLVEVRLRIDVLEAGRIEPDLRIHAVRRHQSGNDRGRDQRHAEGEDEFLDPPVAPRCRQDDRNGENRPPDHGVAVVQQGRERRMIVDETDIGRPIEAELPVDGEKTGILHR